MRRRESLVGQVVAVNVLLVVAVVFAATAAAGLNLAVTDQRLRYGAIAISILLLLGINMILLRRQFSPLEELIARLEAIDPAQPTTQFVVPRTTVAEVERLAIAFRRLLRRIEDERRRSGRLVLRAQEEERRRLARDLHDEVNQALTAILLRLQALSEDAPPELDEQIAALKTLVNQAMEELLRLARQLRPASLDDLGLIAAIEGQIARFSEQSGIQSVLHHEGAPEALNDDQQTVIYRVVQEALSNAAQHSGATFVDFDLRVFPSHGVELRVRDNGQGFDARVSPDGSSIGLAGMAERARLVGGELTVTSSPGAGTRVRLYIPQ
ncbi:MAG: two-component system, NarL family, sensor histidine kinase UhpB [Thermoleophilaceae bacterium]|jgi:two-component system sensor histidine kinase UhpB|nr:two-component system, NarL family, sensor histidine kinase UhpB [Thermoleophilaceae bacterium]